MFRSIVLLVGGLASCCAGSLFAQNVVLGQKYGLGAHAYFAGDALKAHEQLTAAIDGGSKDPRVFYFRGLAYLKLGRPQEASEDFQKGAKLETGDVNKFYNVAKALERVQGDARLELEKYRIEARMAARERAERLRKARYEAIRRDEQRVLREQAIMPPVPQSPAKAADAPTAPVPSTDAFAVPEKKAAPKPAAVEKPAAKPAPPPIAEDPFSAAPAEKAPEAKPAAGEKEPVKQESDAANPFAS